MPRADPDVTFDRAEWPIGDLSRLFSIRNALVHHKPNKPPKDDITLPLIADFLIAGAEAACRLVAADKRQDIRPMLITRMPTTSVRGAQVHEGLAPARRRGRPSA